MICIVNADPMGRLNNAQVKIREFWNFLRGHREVLVDTRKEVLEDVGVGVDTHEAIYGESNY